MVRKIMLVSVAILLATLDAKAAEIVCLTADDPNNYQATQFLESLRDRDLQSSGHRLVIVKGNHAEPTHFVGLEGAIKSADLLLVFVRRATLPIEQLKLLKSHVAAGKPVVGIRTANHAFEPTKSAQIPAGCEAWPGFVSDVLGCRNAGYETRGLPYRVSVNEQFKEHEILGAFEVQATQGYTSLYRVLPVADDAQVLLYGKADGIEPAQPVAWIRTLPSTRGRVFYTSLGDPRDVEQTEVRRLVVAGINWALAGSPN